MRVLRKEIPLWNGKEQSEGHPLNSLDLDGDQGCKDDWNLDSSESASRLLHTTTELY